MSKIWGIPSPRNWWPKSHPFSTTSQLNGNFNGLYLPNETWYAQSASALETTMGLLYRLKMSWTLVHKRLKIGLHFTRSVNSAFYFIATLRRRRSAKGTQPNIAKRWTANGTNNMLWKSRGLPSPKIGAKTFTLVRFFDDFKT